MGAALQITAHEAIFLNADVQSHGAGIFNGRHAVFLHQGKHSQDAADADLALPVIAAGRTCPSGCRHGQRAATAAPYSAAFSWGGLLPRCDSRRVSDADAREEVGWCSDAGCARAVRPIALSLDARSILAASCNTRLRLPHNHPDERHVLRIGSSGRVPEAVLAGTVFLLRTWPQPGAWWCHGCVCRPSVLPNGRDTFALLPGSRNASL